MKGELALPFLAVAHKRRKGIRYERYRPGVIGITSRENHQRWEKREDPQRQLSTFQATHGKKHCQRVEQHTRNAAHEVATVKPQVQQPAHPKPHGIGDVSHVRGGNPRVAGERAGPLTDNEGIVLLGVLKGVVDNFARGGIVLCGKDVLPLDCLGPHESVARCHEGVGARVLRVNNVRDRVCVIEVREAVP